MWRRRRFRASLAALTDEHDAAAAPALALTLDGVVSSPALRVVARDANLDLDGEAFGSAEANATSTACADAARFVLVASALTRQRSRRRSSARPMTRLRFCHASRLELLDATATATAAASFYFQLIKKMDWEVELWGWAPRSPLTGAPSPFFPLRPKQARGRREQGLTGTEAYEGWAYGVPVLTGDRGEIPVPVIGPPQAALATKTTTPGPPARACSMGGQPVLHEAKRARAVRLGS